MPAQAEPETPVWLVLAEPRINCLLLRRARLIFNAEMLEELGHENDDP